MCSSLYWNSEQPSVLSVFLRVGSFIGVLGVIIYHTYIWHWVRVRSPVLLIIKDREHTHRHTLYWLNLYVFCWNDEDINLPKDCCLWLLHTGSKQVSVFTECFHKFSTHGEGWDEVLCVTLSQSQSGGCGLCRNQIKPLFYSEDID